ncbi:uncharacterized protein LOC124689981 [Lolium rigidum]|uniref:uncharacterized protein LOC124689981 n=1 Tax=Lolium rigidum TaxID=89674 RepID=UPI001F5C8D07|nr:uncharacterized protein LOC124689981 [Lolium rigidum]
MGSRIAILEPTRDPEPNRPKNPLTPTHTSLFLNFPTFFPISSKGIGTSLPDPNSRPTFFPGGNRAESPPSLLPRGGGGESPPSLLPRGSSGESPPSLLPHGSGGESLPSLLPRRQPRRIPAQPPPAAAPSARCRILLLAPRTPNRRARRHRLLCSSQPAAAPSPSIVGGLLDYLNESWTQFHATAEAKRQLLIAGFKLLSENDDWDLQPGGRYFFTRNMSCLVAFAVGEKYRVGNGFNIIAAHTDSPCLKLKPRSASFKSGHQMINVQTYGGGLWHTWFDRDLTLAGRVILRAADGSFAHKLVKEVRFHLAASSARPIRGFTFFLSKGSKSDNT